MCINSNVEQFSLIHREDPIKCYQAGQSGSGSDGNEGLLRCLLRSGITEASLSEYLVSNPGHLLEESYPSAAMQSVYSARP